MKKSALPLKRVLALTLSGILLSSNALAQFTGPAATGSTSTVVQAQNARINSYVVVTGNIVNHLREDYYTFRDATGEMRVEIEPAVWRNRQIGPTTTVRLRAEVDMALNTTRYLWVQSLDIVE
jgi:uncharacterized protein (TIGR00156 family)